MRSAESDNATDLTRSCPIMSLFSRSSAAGCLSFFFFNDTATTEIYTLSLHDALPICAPCRWPAGRQAAPSRPRRGARRGDKRKTTGSEPPDSQVGEIGRAHV